MLGVVIGRKFGWCFWEEFGKKSGIVKHRDIADALARKRDLEAAQTATPRRLEPENFQ